MKSARLWLRLSPALIEGLDELAKNNIVPAKKSDSGLNSRCDFEKPGNHRWLMR